MNLIYNVNVFVAKEYVDPSLVIAATPLKQTEARAVENTSPVMNLNDSTPHMVKDSSLLTSLTW